MTGEEIASVVLLIAVFAIIITVVFLANIAEKERSMPVANDTNKWILIGLLAFGWICTTVTAGIMIGSDTLLADQLDDSPLDLLVFGKGMLLSSAIMLLSLLRPVRGVLSKLIPIDPDNLVHMTALYMTTLIIINFAMTASVGLDQIAAAGSGSANGLLLTLWVQQLLTALLGIVGVGWMIRRRTFTEVRERLGLTRITPLQFIASIGIAFLLLGIVVGLTQFAEMIKWDSGDVEAATEAMLGPLFASFFGIFTLGAAAAIGEETIFRGAIQPRFGLVLTTLLFAFVHANYSFSIATIVVIVLGFALGLIRKHYSTTMAMVVHATYNMTIGFIGYAEENGFFDFLQRLFS